MSVTVTVTARWEVTGNAIANLKLKFETVTALVQMHLVLRSESTFGQCTV